MKSKNADGVFSDSLVFNSQIDHFASLFPGSSLFQSALMVGPRLNFINSKIQFYLGEGESNCCFFLPNSAHVLSTLPVIFLVTHAN